MDGNLIIIDKDNDTLGREKFWSSYSQAWAFATLAGEPAYRSEIKFYQRGVKLVMHIAVCRWCILTDSLFRAHQTSCISLYWSKASEVSGLKGPEAYNTSTIPASSSNTPTSNSKYRAPKGMTRHIAPASRVWNQSQDTTSLASLLVPTTKFPLSPSIKRIMKAWVTRPSTTVVADFEYHIALLPTMRHEAVFEIAIANASGDWVIPPVTINHQISSSEPVIYLDWSRFGAFGRSRFALAVDPVI